MSEIRFLIARNSWCAKHIMKQIYQGRRPEFNRVLFKSRREACRRWGNLSLIKQEENQVFEVEFDESRIVRS